MIHPNQPCTLAAILFLVAFVPGCGQENERAAKITGTVDKSTNLTPAESKARLQGVSPGTVPKGYPGSGGSNRR